MVGKISKCMPLERLGSIARLRSKVAELAGMLGEALEFRLAYDGEFTGCDDGVVVLPSSEAFISCISGNSLIRLHTSPVRIKQKFVSLGAHMGP